MSDTRIPLSALKKVRSNFSGLDESKFPEKSTGQCNYREYVFTEAVAFDIYKIAKMKDEEIINHYNTITSKTFKQMTEEDFHKFIMIALNVRNPVSRNENVMALSYNASLLCKDYNDAQPTKNKVVPFIAASESGKTYTVVPSTVESGDTTPIEETTSDKADAICFYFAWFTRFAVKFPSTSALGKQYDKVRETYLKFYQKSSKIFYEFRPDSEWISCLKNCFDSLPRVTNTLVLHVAAAETYHKTTAKLFNILRYLFFQNLEFMGMHAYVSIVSIINKVALPPGLVLTWLRISGSEAAVDEAYHIMSVLDNGMIKNGATEERLWKYARILDQGYFNRLQTTYSAELMAALAYIEIHLGPSQEGGYNSPLNIYAIANNPHIKAIGKMKAEAFIECKNAMISMSEESSVIDKIYAKRAGVAIFATPIVPMEVDPASQKRKAPETPEPSQEEEAAKRTKSPPAAGIPKGPNV
ncbi:nucleocapsid protein [Cardamom vein clearing nucleorhabdovirus 1]|uniref:Nucleoprotein n=1 Tax=cardamom vein clearing virus TaxID=2849749 RepID=A0A6M6R847_9RHAB|nr:nucleocapsid protein [Cardamom vein clearing nucleorhabdovirus 1]QJZ27979.1 nucleocapsid protein [Cardamom vein clearing nucleorhabdovirus 1]